jgi:DNA polymerase eta
MVRLGMSRDTPLAVQQWDSLIAINYAARPFGVTRMLSATEAKKRCPGLVLQHVATFREGEGGKWAYRDDAAQNIKTDKVSLDPYRAESRKIVAVIQEDLSRWRDRLAGLEGGALIQVQPAKLEKASIDEVFMDLSSLVSAVLYERYPELRQIPPRDDKTTRLPSPPTTALDWSAEDGLVDLDEHETEEDDPDWDDVAMLIGAEIVRSVRQAVWDRLNYTCSAGIARNKMMAKLGSARHKPNKQTVVRNRAVHKFLGGFNFTKIRMLGGKLGDQITAQFGTEKVSELLKVSMEQLKAKLDDDTATWLYGIIRGLDNSEVNTRTQIKSMLSAKSFRPSINSADQAEKWLRIFAADLYNRLVEDGLLEHKRRPKTITLHHRTGSQVSSKQLPIPGGRTIDEDTLFDLAGTLLGQVILEGRAWPSLNLSLSVGGFEDGVVGNRAIDSFLVRGPAAVSMTAESSSRSTFEHAGGQGRTAKRRRVENGGIQRFFGRNPKSESDSEEQSLSNDTPTTPRPYEKRVGHPPELDLHHEIQGDDGDAHGAYICGRCDKAIPENEWDEHDDWHFAKDLETRDMEAPRAPHEGTQKEAMRTSADRKKAGPGRTRSGKPERGQTRLAFG